MATTRAVLLRSATSQSLASGLLRLLCISLACQLVSTQVLFFGDATIVKGVRAFHMVNETLEVTCVLPSIALQNQSLCFYFGRETYNKSSHELIVLNETAVMLNRIFDKPEPEYIMLSCRPSQSGRCERQRNDVDDYVYLYVNYGLLLAKQHANCTAMLPHLESRVDEVNISVSCDVTINFNSDNPPFIYEIYFGTRSDSQEVSWPPKNYRKMPLKLNGTVRGASVLNATVFYLRTYLRERFSERSTTLRNEISVVNSLQLPKDILRWEPLENGTGFLLTLNAGYLAHKCGVWNYYAAIRLTSTKYTYNTSRVLSCSLCNGTCREIWAELKPATNYSVELRHRLFLVGASDPGSLQAMPPERDIFIRTAELEPLIGPTVNSEVVNCTKDTTLCKAANGTDMCYIVKLAWEELLEDDLRGHLVEYRMNIAYNTINGVPHNNSIIFPPSQRTETICWNGRDTIFISVAGRTVKGYPPPSSWGKSVVLPKDQGLPNHESTTQESERNSLQTAAVIGGVLGMATVLLAVTMCIIKGNHYRMAWRNRLRIPKIKPSGIAAAQHRASFLRNSYMEEQLPGSMTGLGWLDQGLSKSSSNYSWEVQQLLTDSAFASSSTRPTGEHGDEPKEASLLDGYVRDLTVSSDAHSGEPLMRNFRTKKDLNAGDVRNVSHPLSALQIYPKHADWQDCGSSDIAYVKSLDFQLDQEPFAKLPRASDDYGSSVTCSGSLRSSTASSTLSEEYQQVIVSADEMRKLLSDATYFHCHPSLPPAAVTTDKEEAAVEGQMPLSDLSTEVQQKRKLPAAEDGTVPGSAGEDTPPTADPSRYELITFSQCTQLSSDEPKIITKLLLESDYVAAI